MNKQIALILLARLEGAKYLDRTSGIVQVVSKFQETEDGIKYERRIPFAHNITINETATAANAMIPNSSYKSCLYFEDGGINVIGRVGSRIDYAGRLRVVCWLNMNRVFGYYDPEYSAKIEADIIRLLTTPSNVASGIFSRINCSVVNIPPADRNIFALYDYDEREGQYLLPPFSFFAIDFEVRFSVQDSCLQEFVPVQDNYLTDEFGVLLTDETGDPLTA